MYSEREERVEGPTRKKENVRDRKDGEKKINIIRLILVGNVIRNMLKEFIPNLMFFFTRIVKDKEGPVSEWGG